MQLDKICPACKKPVSRRKAGACPECGVPLFVDTSKQLRRESDKETITQLVNLEMLYLRKRDDIFVDGTAERKYGYALLDKTREFHAKMNILVLPPKKCLCRLSVGF